MSKKGVNLGEKNGQYKYPAYYIKCANCDKTIRVPGSIKNKKFCNIKCKAEWQSKNAKKENNYFHTHAKETREAFRKKYGVSNPMQVPEIKKRSVDSLKNNGNIQPYYSKVSIRLFEELITSLDLVDYFYKKKEFFIRNGKSVYFYDFRMNNKIIEFNGDYFHCNPKVYGSDYFHIHKQKTAKEIWSEDSKKIRFAESKGFDVLVIWEKDYKDNKEAVLFKCIDFLGGV